MAASNRWKQEAKQLIEAAERSGGATVKTTKSAKKKKPKRWRTRAYKRVARKHPILALPAWLGVAIIAWLGQSIKWTGIWTGRGTKAANVRLVAQIRAELQQRKWTPEGPAGDGHREHYRCCGVDHHSIQILNHHNLTTHRGERRAATAATPKLQVGATAKTAGKVLVLPAEKTGGRHRRAHRLPGARNVDDLVKHYRSHFNTIGANIMAVESTTRRLRQAAQAFGSETPVVAGMELAELREICVGMEKAMGALSDSINEFGAKLKKPADLRGEGGPNVAAELVNPFLGRAREYADGCGREFTRFIAAFEVYYAAAIQLTRRGNGLPNIDLTKTG